MLMYFIVSLYQYQVVLRLKYMNKSESSSLLRNRLHKIWKKSEFCPGFIQLYVDLLQFRGQNVYKIFKTVAILLLLS